MLIPLLITFRTRGNAGEKVHLTVCVNPGTREPGCDTGSTPACCMRLDKSLVPLCFTCPWGFLGPWFNMVCLCSSEQGLSVSVGGPFSLCCWGGNREGRLEWATSKPWCVSSVSCYPSCDYPLQANVDYFSKLDTMKYFPLLHARDHPADWFVLCWFSVAQRRHLSSVHCQLFYPSSPLIYSFVTLESNLWCMWMCRKYSGLIPIQQSSYLWLSFSLSEVLHFVLRLTNVPTEFDVISLLLMWITL